MKKFSTQITVLVSHIMHDNTWELCLFLREFPTAAMLNPSVLCQSLAGFNRIKTFVHWKIKNV